MDSNQETYVQIKTNKSLQSELDKLESEYQIRN